jgi:hypothetical protein
MKKLISLLVLAVLITPVHAQDRKLETLVEEWAVANEKLAEVLKMIKDKDSAKAALPTLAEIDRTLTEKQEAINKFDKDENKEAAARIKEKFAERLNQVAEQFETELTRLDGMPDVAKTLSESGIIQKAHGRQEQRAKVDVQVLTRACQAYQLGFGTLPEKLEQLLQPPNGGLSFLEKKDSLLDPWGRPYKYDPKGPKNGGKRPDVWSLGPRHVKDGIIGNWMKP